MVDKSASADLRATKMLIDMMKDVEHKAGEPAPPPEPRRLAASDKEVVQLLVARLRRQILQEIEEAKAAEPPGSPSRRVLILAELPVSANCRIAVVIQPQAMRRAPFRFFPPPRYGSAHRF